MKAIQKNCVGKAYNDFPGALKAFVDVFFRSIDVDGNFHLRRVITNRQLIKRVLLLLNFERVLNADCMTIYRQFSSN